MKNSLPFLLVLAAVPAFGATETHWAQGVGPDAGFYNFKKNGTPFCWLSNAANLVAWWQDQVGTTRRLPDGVPTGAQVHSTYWNAFSYGGGSTPSAIEWWFSGRYRSSSGASPTDPTVGGYYPEVAVAAGGWTESSFPSVFYPSGDDLYLGMTDKQKGFSRYLADKLDDGWAFSARVAGYNRNITVWGAELDDETGLLTRLYISNPSTDDAALEIVTLTPYTYTDSLLGERDTFALTGNDFGETVGVYTLDAFYGVSLAAGNVLPEIPEPSAFGLFAGTLALALAGTRRRRKPRGRN